MKDGYFSSDRNKNFCMTTCTLSNVKIQKKNWGKIFTKDTNRQIPQN